MPSTIHYLIVNDAGVKTSELLMSSQANFLTHDENARRRRVQLDSLLVLNDDALVIDTDFVLGPSFYPGNTTAAIYVPGKRVRWQNSTIISPFTRYNPAWLADSNLRDWSALRIDRAENLVVDGFHAEGFPWCGIDAYGIRVGTFTRLSATRCYFPIAFGSPYDGNHDITIDGARVWDTWGPSPYDSPGAGGSPSRVIPGGWTGADGFLGYFTRATLSNIEASGEIYAGMKLVRSADITITDCITNTLMFQGTDNRYNNNDLSTNGCSNVIVRRTMIDKRRGSGDTTDLGEGMQVSWNVVGLDVAECSFIAGGTDGHAIQLAGNCHGVFRDCVIAGWNGQAVAAWDSPRGSAPTYAIDVIDGSTVNADFVAANQFYRQNLMVRLSA